MSENAPIRIDPSLLEPATLRSVIEEFVTRDGTEFSQLDTKIRQVQALLARGEVELWFDPLSATCSLRAV